MVFRIAASGHALEQLVFNRPHETNLWVGSRLALAAEFGQNSPDKGTTTMWYIVDMVSFAFDCGCFNFGVAGWASFSDQPGREDRSWTLASAQISGSCFGCHIAASP